MSELGVESPGALLRAAREKQGLHIAALAAAIKVAPRKLDALENDRWAELPDATFTRALAQTVCRTLKIDARPVLELLPAPSAAALENAGAGLNTPFRDRPGREEPGMAFGAIKPMVWAASALMVAAVAVYFLPEGFIGGGGAPAPAASVPVAVALPPPVVASAASAVALAAVPDAPASASVVAAAPVAVETVFAAPAAASAPAGPVQLRSSEASWVEARDGRGQLLLSRHVQPGESVGLDGQLPIRLTIGNAAATQIAFRGRPVDLAPHTRNNVARIELQP